MRKFAIIAATVLSSSTAAQGQTPAPPDALTGPAAAKQPAHAPASQPTFRSGTSMVALNVTVTNGRKLVTGLSREHFEVYEDGVQQEVRFFESKSIPMDVILLIDASSSMRDRMSTVHDAAKGFMKMLREGDRGAVVAFNDRVSILQDLTSDSDAIERAISSTRGSGSTALHNALYVALKEFGSPAQLRGDVRRQALAVLSDGEDTSSVVAFNDVVELARRSGVAIYTIGLQSQTGEVRAARERLHYSASAYALRALAKETGAQAFFPENVHELKTVYDTISEELEAQYSIAYTPSNSRQDGSFRRILVRVTADPSFRPRARAGYTAESVRSSVDGSTASSAVGCC